MTMRKLDLLWKRHQSFTKAQQAPQQQQQSKTQVEVKAKPMDSSGRVAIDALGDLF